MHPLDDPRLKLTRACTHMDELDAALHAYQVVKPHLLAEEFDTKNHCYVYRFQFPKPPPLQMGIIVGDVVHNLRSSLDHLVWRLARLATAVPHRDVHFPILKEKNPGEMLRRLRDMPPTAQEVIEGTEWRITCC